MAWLLFIDESGHDGGASPYEVLAGIAVEDRKLWPLIRQLSDAQAHHFGVRRFRQFEDEAKARKLLKKKTFRLAAQSKTIRLDVRRTLARAALEDGANVSGGQLTALGQAKLEYCRHALRLCVSHGCTAFASIVPRHIERTKGDFLRKDYAFLFERYFHFLNSRDPASMGMIVFDELEKSQSHLLVTQMDDYFIKTRNGRARSRLIVPEPLFVHSDLTTMIQMADVIAYVIAWGVRIRGMSAPNRKELLPFADQVLRLRYHHATPGGERVWGFKLIDSLLPRDRA